MSEDLQRKLQTEIESFQGLQKQYQKAMATRRQLAGQYFENTTVKEELEHAKDQEVLKLIGPVLIKQDRDEAIQNVMKRIEFIQSEIRRTDDVIVEMEKSQDARREVLNKLQRQYQKAQVGAALKP